jgi:VanZ family protein
VYDTLLFLHVLSGFLLFVTVVVLSAVVLGAPAPRRLVGAANLFWDVGALGTLVFGVWLAIYLDSYHPWDGWIVSAIVLWMIATGIGVRERQSFVPATAEGGIAPAAVDAQRAATMHWIRTVVVIALLAVMIFKPGA